MAQCVKDLAFLVSAMAWVLSLAQKFLHATGVVKKSLQKDSKKKKKKERKRKAHKSLFTFK